METEDVTKHNSATSKTFYGEGIELRIMHDKTTRFIYSIDDEGGTFECSMLCEVGVPFAPAFDHLLSIHNLRVNDTPTRLPKKPWLADSVSFVQNRTVTE